MAPRCKEPDPRVGGIKAASAGPGTEERLPRAEPKGHVSGRPPPHAHRFGLTSAGSGLGVSLRRRPARPQPRSNTPSRQRCGGWWQLVGLLSGHVLAWEVVALAAASSSHSLRVARAFKFVSGHPRPGRAQRGRSATP